MVLKSLHFLLGVAFLDKIIGNVNKAESLFRACTNEKVAPDFGDVVRLNHVFFLDYSVHFSFVGQKLLGWLLHA